MNKAEVIDFFKQYILGWMCKDIGECIKAEANVAVAALLMSYSENVGTLIEGHLGLTGTSGSDFRKFLEYLEFNGNPDYYKQFKIKCQDSGSSSVKTMDIYTAFRCGLIHEYAPKLSCIIQNNPDNIDNCSKDDPGIGWYNPSSPGGPIGYSGYIPPVATATPALRFHTNAYFRDFRNALNRIYKDMSANSGLLNNVKRSVERVRGRKLII